VCRVSGIYGLIPSTAAEMGWPWIAVDAASLSFSFVSVRLPLNRPRVGRSCPQHPPALLPAWVQRASTGSEPRGFRRDQLQSSQRCSVCPPLSLSLSLWSLQSREPPLCLSVCPRKACGRLSPVSQTRFKCSPRLKCMFELFVLNKSNLH